MFSEDAIDNLIQPIIDRQQNINNYVINIIAERIKEIGSISSSDLFKLERLLKSGHDVKKINTELAILTGLQVQDIKTLIKTIAENSYLDVRPFYDYRMLSFIPFSENKQLQKVVTSIANQTAESYVNLSKAQAFMIRDLKNPKILKPTPLAQTYQTVIDEAIQASTLSGIDYNTAMRRTMKQLIDSGIRRVTYNPESGKTYTQRLDTAVRRNVLDGIRAISQGVQDETGKQFGADGKEITVHAFPAPDHAPVQGHQFSNYEFEKMQTGYSCMDVQGRAYAGFDRAIGTLNCRHFTFSIIIGFAPPNYSDEQLEKILQENEAGYTLPNGKHLTMYECTQYQRKLETEIRYAKDGQIAARKSGDMELAREYQAKINKLTTKYKHFSNSCGLSIKSNKMTVSGYKKIKINS